VYPRAAAPEGAVQVARTLAQQLVRLPRSGLAWARAGDRDAEMRPVLVLVHSLSVGPLTWKPIANRLAARGREGVVPSLLKVADAGGPFWPRVVEDVAAAGRLEHDRRMVLVAHSNAGLLVPLLVKHAV
jgi:pimeloyl-ACP methyl ester carboxylesterase